MENRKPLITTFACSGRYSIDIWCRFRAEEIKGRTFSGLIIFSSLRRKLFCSSSSPTITVAIWILLLLIMLVMSAKSSNEYFKIEGKRNKYEKIEITSKINTCLQVYRKIKWILHLNVKTYIPTQGQGFLST